MIGGVGLEKKQLIPKRWIREADVATGKGWNHPPDVYLRIEMWHVCLLIYFLSLGTIHARAAFADNKNLIYIG